MESAPLKPQEDGYEDQNWKHMNRYDFSSNKPKPTEQIIKTALHQGQELRKALADWSKKSGESIKPLLKMVVKVEAGDISQLRIPEKDGFTGNGNLDARIVTHFSKFGVDVIFVPTPEPEDEEVDEEFDAWDDADNDN